ncbi:probable serine/threonine-protein kinase fhkD isoform X4 [Culex pipiens pallens]|uniref:probable serine/threonine-protein kinase fhkD isoform X4 n=1 Tax=Culex pipiens pallens TaxID=42434 RepID=UPI0022AA190B|nr:probable serine/threonine-protein kinase fhkD isoform X4 [Culex pipiens pallens]
MIHVDESDPVGDVPPPFPYREVEIQRGVDAKQLYELSTEIGRGKFGVVHTCTDKSTGLRLAAKFIKIEKKGDRKNIEREVHMMNVLRHAKIAQLYAAYEYDRTFCMVLELVQGGELFDRVLDEKFLLTEKACSIFMRQICDAIAYIHGNNIVHLDLKPENILCLTESGNRIKIIDFGLAREYDPDNKLQVLFGTPEFVAPEVVNFEAISFATDMWSVGVIAYVLVSGLSPFAGEDDIQTMGNITIGRYDFLDEAFDTVSEEAIDFINRCLVKDPNERINAEQALKHKWIKRKPQYYPTNPRRPSIPVFKPILLEDSNDNNSNVHLIFFRQNDAEIDKENLKDLVSKWNESPNNRYAFDQASESVISPSGDLIPAGALLMRRTSGDASGGRRGSLARDEDDPLLLSPSSSTSCCSTLSPPPPPLSSEVTAPQSSPHRPALAPLEVVSNTGSASSNSSELNHSQSAGVTTGGQAQPEVTPKLPTTNTTTKIKVCDELRMLSDLLKMKTPKEDQQPPPVTCDPKHLPEQQHNSTLNGNNNSNSNINLGTTPPKPPTSPLSPTTLSTADLDSDLESLKSKLKVKTSRAQNKLNELAQQPDFLANDPFKLPTFKFLPKSISLCNDDSVFKENYTKFCDRNAILPPTHIQESHQEVSSTSSTSSTTTVSEGTKVIVTKTTKSSKLSADGTKTVTVKKTIVKQKKITEQEQQDVTSAAATTTTPTKESSTASATVKRTKFRVNQMSSRDVPVAINSVAKRYLEQNRIFATETALTVPKDDCLVKKLHKSHVHTTSETESANNLKNTMKIRSISVDWGAKDAVENRSMKSINSFLKRTSTSSSTTSSAVKQIQAQIEASIHK